jgi:hypothetical protein
MVDFNVLDQEMAALQPLEPNLPVDLSVWARFTSLQIPRTDQYLQTLERGIALGRLLLRLGVGSVVVFHCYLSFSNKTRILVPVLHVG